MSILPGDLVGIQILSLMLQDLCRRDLKPSTDWGTCWSLRSIGDRMCAWPIQHLPPSFPQKSFQQRVSQVRDSRKRLRDRIWICGSLSKQRIKPRWQMGLMKRKGNESKVPVPEIQWPKRQLDSMKDSRWEKPVVLQKLKEEKELQRRCASNPSSILHCCQAENLKPTALFLWNILYIPPFC